VGACRIISTTDEGSGPHPCAIRLRMNGAPKMVWVGHPPTWFIKVHPEVSPQFPPRGGVSTSTPCAKHGSHCATDSTGRAKTLLRPLRRLRNDHQPMTPSQHPQRAYGPICKLVARRSVPASQTLLSSHCLSLSRAWLCIAPHDQKRGHSEVSTARFCTPREA